MKRDYSKPRPFFYIFLFFLANIVTTVAFAQEKKELSIEAMIIQQELYGNEIPHADKVTIRKDIFGKTIIEDNRGYQKTIGKDIFGGTVIEDSQGYRKTISKDIFGNTIIEDNQGNKKTIGKDIFGDTFIEDNKGGKTTIRKDIFGDIIIEKR